MADNWEYHQDERDRAYAYGALLVLGAVVLAVLGVAAMVALVIMQI